MILPSHLGQRPARPLIQVMLHHLFLKLRGEARPLSRHETISFPERTLLGPKSGKLEARHRSFFTGLVVRVAIEPVLPEPAGSAWGDAVAAIDAAAAAAERRFAASLGQGLVEGLQEGVVMSTVTCWQAAAAATDAGLLTPGWGPAATRWGR